ncbi:hypothetical protein [Flavobacterium sp. J27]|uniref:hypothetical protein n=1 Tax=Flavobacterium sp. J27 TaxID=2060419 RepID=UPI001030B3B0|nr:hypothetical protein [Flavobacterium sp. J27]
MKKEKLSYLLFVFLLLNVITSCTKDESSSSDKADPSPVINTVSQGTWKITFYEDSGTDETSSFEGYTFTFGSSNVVTATNGSNTYTGTWSVTNNNSNSLHFNISFNSPVLFSSELNDDWDIITYSATVLKLVDNSGLSNEKDYLTFLKN